MRKKLPQLTVIIPTWNGVDFLKICLPSIQRQSYKNYEVIIIDNGSTDQTAEFVKVNFPYYQLVKLEKNFGFAKAVNVGIKRAQGKFIMLVNNDCQLDRNCFKYLVNAAKKDSKTGMIAPKVMNYYHRQILDNCGDYIDITGHLHTRGFGQKDTNQFNQPEQIFLVTGGGGLFKKEVFDKVGLFDEDLFMYMEDADLSLRAQFQGFKAWFEPRAIIYHIRMGSSSRNRALFEYLAFRNMTIIVIKDFPRQLLLENFNWLKAILVNLHTIYYLAKKGYLIPALKADFYILTHLSQILKKRQQVQSTIAVPLDYIISQVHPKRLV